MPEDAPDIVLQLVVVPVVIVLQAVFVQLVIVMGTVEQAVSVNVVPPSTPPEQTVVLLVPVAHGAPVHLSAALDVVVLVVIDDEEEVSLITAVAVVMTVTGTVELMVCMFVTVVVIKTGVAWTVPLSVTVLVNVVVLAPLGHAPHGTVIVTG